jgi:hypothetical protein
MAATEGKFVGRGSLWRAVGLAVLIIVASGFVPFDRAYVLGERVDPVVTWAATGLAAGLVAGVLFGIRGLRNWLLVLALPSALVGSVAFVAIFVAFLIAGLVLAPNGFID